MIGDFFFLLASIVLNLIAGVFNVAATYFNLPLSQITDGIAYWIAPAYYFQGVMPVDTMLQIIGLTLALLSAIFALNVFEWLWHKIPFLGH